MQPGKSSRTTGPFFHRTTNAAGKIEPANWPVVRLDFPGCICSPMEKRVPTRTIARGFENASGLGFWTIHPLHHAHMVNRQSHVRPEPCEARARRARAKNRMRKAGNHEPTASQMIFVGTRFSIGLQMQPGKSSRTTGQLSGPIFPAAFVVRWKNAFPH
jgi:hypothetical protein